MLKKRTTPKALNAAKMGTILPGLEPKDNEK